MARTPSEIVGRQVARIRGVRRLSQRELAQRLQAAGVKIDPSAIARLETAQRRVTVDELVMLAVVLDVSPVFLLQDRDDDDVSLGDWTVAGGDYRAWVALVRPLAGQDVNAFRGLHDTFAMWRTWEEQTASADRLREEAAKLRLLGQDQTADAIEARVPELLEQVEAQKAAWRQATDQEG